MKPIEYAGIVVMILEVAALAFLICAWFRDKRMTADEERGTNERKAD